MNRLQTLSKEIGRPQPRPKPYRSAGLIGRVIVRLKTGRLSSPTAVRDPNGPARKD